MSKLNMRNEQAQHGEWLRPNVGLCRAPDAVGLHPAAMVQLLFKSGAAPGRQQRWLARCLAADQSPESMSTVMPTTAARARDPTVRPFAIALLPSGCRSLEQCARTRYRSSRHAHRGSMIRAVAKDPTRSAEAALGGKRADRGAKDVLDTSEAGAAAIRGSALRTGGYLVGILLSFATAPFLIRHLGVAGFGEYMLVISLVAVVAGLSETGLMTVGVRDYAVSHPARRKALIGEFLGLRVMVTFAGAAGAIAFAALAGYGRTLVVGTLVVSVTLVIQTYQALLAVPLAAGLRLGWIAAADVLRQVITAAVILALVAKGASLLPFFAASVVGALLALILTMRLVRGQVPLRPSFDVGAWRALLRDTLPFAVAIAINASYLRIAIVALSLSASDLEMGYFATSHRILEVFLVLPGLLVFSVFPIMARAARDDVDRLAFAVRRVFEVSLILGVWFLIVLELGADFAIHVVGGAEAEPAKDILRVQALAVVATSVTMACGYPLLALRKHSAILLSNLCALGASITLLAVLVPPYEARGAAVATIGAELALAVATALLLARAHERIQVAWDVLPPVLLAAGLAFSITFLPGAHDVVKLALATAMYFGALKVFGRLPPGIRQAWSRV
jgi:O-antigen/teichoic acid export membrane protein